MLPDVKSPTLKVVLLILIGSCIAMFFSAVQSALSSRYIPLVVSILLWAPLAWGLWRLHPVARKVSVVLLWLVVIVLPIGVINPFAAMDGMVDPHASLWTLLVPVYSVVALALFMLHILGKHKSAFTAR